MSENPPEYIYKITTRALWAEGQRTGTLPRSEVDEKDGFMHLSTSAQLAETLRLHFAGESDLVIARVPVAPHGAALKWEPSRGGALFPHLYAPLGMAAITAHEAVAVASDGACQLPEFVR